MLEATAGQTKNSFLTVTNGSFERQLFWFVGVWGV